MLRSRRSTCAGTGQTSSSQTPRLPPILRPPQNKSEGSGPAPSTPAFILHASGLPQYFTCASTFFSDSFITTEGSDADTSIRGRLNRSKQHLSPTLWNKLHGAHDSVASRSQTLVDHMAAWLLAAFFFFDDMQKKKIKEREKFRFSGNQSLWVILDSALHACITLLGTGSLF